jgi:hypothetical protein
MDYTIRNVHVGGDAEWLTPAVDMLALRENDKLTPHTDAHSPPHMNTSAVLVSLFLSVQHIARIEYPHRATRTVVAVDLVFIGEDHTGQLSVALASPHLCKRKPLPVHG